MSNKRSELQRSCDSKNKLRISANQKILSNSIYKLTILGKKIHSFEIATQEVKTIQENFQKQRNFTFSMANVRQPELFIKGMEVDYWLAKLDLFFSLTQVTLDRDKMHFFGSFLDRDAFEIVNKWMTCTNFDELKEKFKNFFGKREPPAHVYMQLFANRYQEADEDLLEYATALNWLGLKAFPGMLVADLDRYLQNQY